MQAQEAIEKQLNEWSIPVRLGSLSLESRKHFDKPQADSLTLYLKSLDTHKVFRFFRNTDST